MGFDAEESSSVVPDDGERGRPSVTAPQRGSSGDAGRRSPSAATPAAAAGVGGQYSDDEFDLDDELELP
jgi:hypothetical protein